MTIDEFINYLKELNIEITNNQLKQLELYYELLIEWNNKINLTGITEHNEVYLKHFYDSLTICRDIDLNEIDSLADIGTGAGFPGMVIKILFPKLEVELIDSLGKRITFLNDVVDKLKLENINIINARAEEYALKVREKYDVVTARAVAPLNILLEYCIPLVKENGYFIPLKANCDEEINGIKNAINVLNCKIEKIDKFKLPKENSTRTIIKFKKNDITLKKYPRRFNEIKKKPL